jgi:hypothetical protein
MLLRASWPSRGICLRRPFCLSSLDAFVNLLWFGCDKTTQGFVKAHIKAKRRIELRSSPVDHAINALYVRRPSTNAKISFIRGDGLRSRRLKRQLISSTYFCRCFGLTQW